MSSVYLLMAPVLFIYLSFSIFDLSMKLFILNTFVSHNAVLLLQLAMRGPSGPMGLTGRPGPLVCIFTYTTSLFKLNIVQHFSTPVLLRVLLVCQD